MLEIQNGTGYVLHRLVVRLPRLELRVVVESRKLDMLPHPPLPSVIYPNRKFILCFLGLDVAKDGVGVHDLYTIFAPSFTACSRNRRFSNFLRPNAPVSLSL